MGHTIGTGAYDSVGAVRSRQEACSIGWFKRPSNCGQRASPLVTFLRVGKDVFFINKRKAVACGSRKRLKAVHFGEHGDRKSTRRPILNPVRTSALARLTARKVDGGTGFE